MESNRFFSVVWRINALVILLAGLLAVGALVAIVVSMWPSGGRSAHEANVADQVAVKDGAEPGDATPGDAEPTTEHAEIGQFENVVGTTSLRAEVRVMGRGGSDYSSKGGDTSTRNYLYFDTATGSARWLMPDHKTEFLIARDFPDHSARAAESNEPVRVTVYQLRTQAPRDGARADRRSRESLAVSDPDGRHFRVLAEGVDEVNAIWLDDPRHLAALYSSGTTLYTLKLDLGAGPGAAPVVTKIRIARP